MATRRLRVLAAMVLFVPLLAGVRSSPALAASGDITTWAGGFGQGPALLVPQQVQGMAAEGRYVYMADRGQQVVRRFDTVTGVQTVAAGNGPSNLNKNVVDGHAATSTLLGDVHGLAVDARGDLYISDSSRHQIYRVDGSGRIWVVAGNGSVGDAGDGGPARDASLDLMFTMAFDGSGNLYVSSGSRIRRITPSGTITTVAGGQTYDPAAPRTPDGAPAVGGRISPIGFAVDPSGVLYVPDRGVVRKIDERGILSTFATGIDAVRLIPRPAGGLYASSDSGVSSIDPTGRITTAMAGFGAAKSLAIDADSNLYVAEFSGSRVRMVAPDGSVRTVAGNGTHDVVGDGGQASDAILRFARDVAFDGRGIGYVTEDAYNRVRRVDRSGVLTTFAGSFEPGFSGDGGPATAAALNGPTRVVADGGGNVYISDEKNRRIRRVDGNGIITTVAGNGGSGQYGITGDGGPATAATIGYVGDLALDVAGNLYLSGGARVRKVDAVGIITTVAGTGESGFSGDGGPATAARLGATTGIDVDATGTLAIVAFGRIRRVTPDGRITTIATLITPSSIASDRAGGWFVASGEQVHRINAAGKVLVAGTGESDQNDDVGPATRAPLTRISGVAFDGTDLFIAAVTRVRRVAMAASIPPAPAPRAAAGWGMNTYGQTSGSPTINPVLAPSGTVETTAVAAGWYHSLAVTPGGGVRAWGWNHFGQLGRGTTTGSTAILVPGLSNVRSVAAGVAHSLALKADGTVWAWGYNGQGQLGTGSTTDSRVPVQVRGLTGVVAIAAGGLHSLAVDSGGRVHAWGWNGLGALGQGHTYDRPLPTTVPFHVSSDAVGVAGGAYHSLVVWRDGTVWSFGWNGLGQLGNGSTTDSSRPARIPGLSGVAEAAGGIAHSLARSHNGEVWAWGWNALGQLGDGTTNDGRTPVPVTALTNVRSVAAGGYHSLAALDSGAVRSWGWNGLGQLGTGSTADSLRATPAGTAGKSEVAAGAAHSLTR